ncbi:MAG: ribonuclease P [bacterium ADurb.Bin212]|nr:MAG: ribonuclease P [bacterium ADurb.Bin212]
MLKKDNRITQNKEFLRMFKTVRPVHTEHLALRCTQRIIDKQETITRRITNSNFNNTKNLKPVTCNLKPRFGFVVSNKIDKRAARRNAIKRRIRAVIEENLSQIPDGIDLVVQIKKPFEYPYNYAKIRQEVYIGLHKIGALK